MLGLNHHPCFQGFDTGSNVGHAIDDHDTVRATPDRTKHTAGLIPPGGVTMNHHPVASQRNGNRFTFKALHAFAIEGEPDSWAFFKSAQYGMFLNAHNKSA